MRGCDFDVRQSKWTDYPFLEESRLTDVIICRAVSDYMSQIAEQEMEKNKEQEMEKDFERGDDQLLRQLEAFLAARGSTSTLFSIVRTCIFVLISYSPLAYSVFAEYSTAEIKDIGRLLIRDRSLVNSILKTENEPEETPMASAITTLIAFLAFGIVPLAASLIFASVLSPFFSSAIWTLLTLFSLGYFKAQWTKQRPMVAGLQMAALGGTSSFIAFVIARILSTFTGTSD